MAPEGRGDLGELVFHCDGGAAEARFGAARFRGAIRHGVLDVVMTAPFDWDDGCKWASEQHLRGRLSVGTLEYTYTEAPLHAQDGCAPPCAARAQVSVQVRAAH